MPALFNILNFSEEVGKNRISVDEVNILDHVPRIVEAVCVTIC